MIPSRARWRRRNGAIIGLDDDKRSNCFAMDSASGIVSAVNFNPAGQVVIAGPMLQQLRSDGKMRRKPGRNEHCPSACLVCPLL